MTGYFLEISATDGTAETRRAGHLALPPGEESLAHDADGNLTGDWRWSYEWDEENRLSAAHPSQAAVTAALAHGLAVKRLEFAYDWHGRRVQRLELEWDVTDGFWRVARDRRFVYDGWNVMSEVEHSNSPPEPRHNYAWGLDLSGTEQGAGGAGGVGGLVLAQSWTGTGGQARVLTPGYDGNGNILTWLAPGTGTVVARYEYDPFGRRLVAEEPHSYQMVSGTPELVREEMPGFGFSTKMEDAETGLVYYGFRYYSPELGRWINRDPIEERGGVNLYGMVRNDPVNFVDYLGLKQKRGCKFEIVVGHGSHVVHDPDWVNGRIDDLVDGAGCGDRFGAASCYNAPINNAIPEDHRIPDIPGRSPGVGDPYDGMWKFSELVEVGIAAVRSAEKQAPKDCGDKETCCSSITIKVNCLAGGEFDVSKYLRGNGPKDFSAIERGKVLCNYSNSYKCPTDRQRSGEDKFTGKFSEKLIDERLKK